MIRVEFETTAADWLAFQRHAVAAVRGFTAKASRGLSWRAVVIGIPVGMFLLGATRVLSFSPDVPTAAVTLGVVLLFWGFFRWQYAKALVPAEGGALVGRRTISLDENGVTEESADHRHQSAWAGIVSVHETDEHLFLMVDRFAGYIVPKRAFRDSAGLSDFVAFARHNAKAQDTSRAT